MHHRSLVFALLAGAGLAAPRLPPAAPLFPNPVFEAGRFPKHVLTTDLDGDGVMDLVVVNESARGVVTLLGGGDGTFSPGGDAEVGPAPASVAAGDFDEDGRTDVVTANVASGDLSFLRGLGNGRFEAEQRIPGFSSNAHVIAASLDADHHLDLVVSSLNGGEVLVLRGAGNGSFTPRWVTGSDASAPAVVADFDDDGCVDLALPGSGAIRIWRGAGDGTFSPGGQVALEAEAIFLATADFNGDGRADLVSSNREDLAILPGRGDGTFDPGVSVSVGPFPAAAVPTDLDGDGRIDLVVPMPTPSVRRVLTLSGAGDGTFGPAHDSWAGGTPGVVVAADFDRDGHADVVAVNEEEFGTVTVLHGRGDGTLARPLRHGFGGSVPWQLAAGQFGPDRIPDLAVTDLADDRVSVLSGVGDGRFAAANVLAPGTRPVAIVTGRLNRDSQEDLVVVNQGSSDVSIFLQRGAAAFGSTLRGHAGYGASRPAAGDLDGDGAAEVVVPNTWDDTLSLLSGFRQGQRPNSWTQVLQGAPTAIALADFDADGDLDAAIARGLARDVLIASGDGRGGLDAGLLPSSPVGDLPVDLVAGDFNGDGVPDLATANVNAMNVSVLIGIGGGRFEPQRRYRVGPNPTAIGTGDFDGDGVPDLAVANALSGDVSILLGRGDGSFEEQRLFSAGPSAHAIALADFDGDGLTDLAAAADADIWILKPDPAAARRHATPRRPFRIR
ncbi:MAG TPA: VCBS repeat-containing protein [Verrucomicrobiae bacterium]|nr:VCBS repeat-containing protein [Verrucomicrobiae bacterium]